jgi:Ca2+-binding RTX toxin-like protein
MVVGASGIGIRAQYSNNYISNLGTVNAIQGIVAGSGGSGGNTVVNSGKIFSVDVGVTLYGSGSSLTNSGLIRTNSFTVAVELQGGPGGTITVHNTGTIESGGATAVHGRSGDDRLTNTGTIIGAVDLEDGHDLYDGRGGTVAGDILLGAGNDTAYGGAEGEWFFGDAGHDLMDGGAGNDTFTIDVADPSAAGGEDTAIGGAGDDTFNLAGGISPKTILNGGEGVDRLELQFGAVMPAPGTNTNAGHRPALDRPPEGGRLLGQPSTERDRDRRQPRRQRPAHRQQRRQHIDRQRRERHPGGRARQRRAGRRHRHRLRPLHGQHGRQGQAG